MGFLLYYDAFKMYRSTTKITKYRDFQYRLLLHKINDNVTLKQWKLCEDEECSFCNREKDSLVHMFYECSKIQIFIETMNELCKTTKEEYKLDRQTFLLSMVVEKQGHIINFICTHMKQYCYRNKCAGKIPSVNGWLSDLRTIYDIEMFNLKREHRKVDGAP